MIRLIDRQQPNNQPNQLASGKYNGALMLMLANFAELAVVVEAILRDVQTDHLSGFTEVVTQEAIARTRELGVP